MSPIALPSTYIPIGLFIENVALEVSMLVIARSTKIVSIELYEIISSLVLTMNLLRSSISTIPNGAVLDRYLYNGTVGSYRKVITGPGTSEDDDNDGTYKSLIHDVTLRRSYILSDCFSKLL